MVVTSKTKNENVDKYPKLRAHVDNDYIVLFTSLMSGTVIDVGSGTYALGYTSKTWASDMFVDYVGRVMLIGS